MSIEEAALQKAATMISLLEAERDTLASDLWKARDEIKTLRDRDAEIREAVRQYRDDRVQGSRWALVYLTMRLYPQEE